MVTEVRKKEDLNEDSYLTVRREQEQSKGIAGK